MNNAASLPALLTVGYQGISYVVSQYRTLTPKGHLECAMGWLTTAGEILSELTDEDRQNIERLSGERLVKPLAELQATYRA